MANSDVALPAAAESEDSEVLRHFKALIAQNIALPVAAMNALIIKIKGSKASTWMELEHELSSAIATLKSIGSEDLGGRTNISLASGCDLFMKFVTRAFNMEYTEFSACKEELLIRGQHYASLSMTSRSRVADLGHSFITDDCTVLVHGYSRVVNMLILRAAKMQQYFNVIVTEGRPNGDGLRTARAFSEAGIPTRIVLDSAVGAMMDRVSMCLVGAEGVMENGGIINKIGTYQIALVAKACQRPFYVAVESYKFARIYPLSQRDVADIIQQNGDISAGTTTTAAAGAIEAELPPSATHVEEKMADWQSVDEREQAAAAAAAGNGDGSFCEREWPKGVIFENPSIDFTPAKLITLLITDLGVFTPAAVSDELIKLYQ